MHGRRPSQLPPQVDAVAHRVVHGGQRFRDPAVIDDDVVAELEALAELAPLHNAPRSRRSSRRGDALPDVPHVAVFDTAFHATMPPRPRPTPCRTSWHEDWGIRRYGFHGLSVQWASEQRAGAAARRLPSRRRLLRHRRAGRPFGRHDHGLQPARRHTDGDALGLDRSADRAAPHPRPGGSTSRSVERALEYESGLLGVSGVSARVEELERSASPRRLSRSRCSRIASLPPSPRWPPRSAESTRWSSPAASVRDQRRCGSTSARRLGFLGIELDEAANGRAVPDADVATPGRRCASSCCAPART